MNKNYNKIKNQNIKSFKNGAGLITELLFLIMIICICFTHITFAIITAIQKYYPSFSYSSQSSPSVRIDIGLTLGHSNFWQLIL